MTLHQSLKDARLKKKLSIQQVATATGIDQSTVFRIETGFIQDPAFSKVAALASLYNLNLNKLGEIQ
jgi:transcriptional regulator with XRE-family HTH domain